MEINIPSYERLENFHEPDYYKLIVDIQNSIIDNSKDYDKLYASIHDLRVLNKYERKAFSMIFDVVYDRLGKLLLSENDQIRAIILTLLLDVFSDSWSYTNIPEWILALLPKVVSISAGGVDESALALEILNKCANNMFHTESIMALLHTLSNTAVSENAYLTLKYLIQNADTTLLVNLTWDNIFFELIELFTINFQLADRFCKILLERFTREELFCILSSINDDDILTNMLTLLKLQHKDKIEVYKLREINN